MEHITMNRKEREQLIVFEKLKNKSITQVEAALQLGISTRWVRKKIKRYLEFEAAGLVHQSRNRISNKRWCENEKAFAIDLLRSDWHDFGPSFAVEKLKEIEDIKISKETMRQVMIKAGIWQAKKKKLKHRKRRERRLMIGLLIQLDGSPHDWFEGRGPWCTLLVFIDDATSRILWLEFAESESFKAVAGATKNYIEKHGRPVSFYVDFGSVFSVNLNNPEREKKTEFERIMAELLVKVSHATSPQAKGRVERANKTLQDRLVKEMRLANVSSMEAANQFVQKGDFIQKHNTKFAVPSAAEGNAHRSIENYNLYDIFCTQENRIVNNDFTVHYKRKLFQLNKRQAAIIRPKNYITISEHLDGKITLKIRNNQLNFKEVGMRKANKLSPVAHVLQEKNEFEDNKTIG